MSLAKVEISGLFGRFDHEISIDPKDKLAIIIAPNGFGKTVSLKLIRAALRLQVAYLQRINFQSIKLHFNDGVVYSITRRKSSASETRKPPQLSVRLVSPNGHDHKHDLVSDDEARHGVSLDALLDHFVSDLQRRGPAEWLDTRTARVLTLTEAIDEYWELIPPQYMRSRKPGWLTDFTKQFEPRLIEAQRLVLVEGRRIEAHGRVGTTESDTTHVVSVQARTLAEKISAAVRQYAARAQQLDQTFPARALQRARSDQHPDQKEIYAALRDLGSRRQELIAVGLIDSVHEVLEVKEEAIEPSLLKFLDVYVSDVREKYAVFDQT